VISPLGRPLLEIPAENVDGLVEIPANEVGRARAEDDEPAVRAHERAEAVGNGEAANIFPCSRGAKLSAQSEASTRNQHACVTFELVVVGFRYVEAKVIDDAGFGEEQQPGTRYRLDF